MRTFYFTSLVHRTLAMLIPSISVKLLLYLELLLILVFFSFFLLFLMSHISLPFQLIFISYINYIMSVDLPIFIHIPSIRPAVTGILLIRILSVKVEAWSRTHLIRVSVIFHSSGAVLQLHVSKLHSSQSSRSNLDNGATTKLQTLMSTRTCCDTCCCVCVFQFLPRCKLESTVRLIILLWAIGIFSMSIWAPSAPLILRIFSLECTSSPRTLGCSRAFPYSFFLILLYLPSRGFYLIYTS